MEKGGAGVHRMGYRRVGGEGGRRLVWDRSRDTEETRFAWLDP